MGQHSTLTVVEADMLFCARLHRSTRLSRIVSPQFPWNLGLFWTESAANRLRELFPNVTGGPAGSVFTGHRPAEEPNIEVTGRRPWSRHHDQQR